ncbi:hypothetical protein BDW68DRAFT_183624 [Aspergillus falconensis]
MINASWSSAYSDTSEVEPRSWFHEAVVIGLQPALILKEADFDVIIVGEDFPASEDPLYTSTW